ncbi:MAG TPA: hypothetical protein VGS07_23145 [Thermoanaerobaculia bacterium]|nr:hypothetical protein [Thermoanaerobaculia bacterium]
MFTRNAALIAALTVSSFGFAASSAHAQYFGVDTSAQTLGYIGTYSDNSGWLVNHTSASSLSDPAGVTLSSPSYGSAFADVGAGSHAEQGLLHAWASAHTNPVTGNSFPGSAPYGYGYAHFTDRLTVTSSTLSAGTKVMIVFGNVVDRTTWTYSGFYDGYIDMRVQIGVATAMSRWTANYAYGDTAVDAPLLTVNTTVGSTFSVDGKLGVQAKAMYYDPAHVIASDINAEATASLVVRQIPDGVTLVSASGIVYPFVPGN